MKQTYLEALGIADQERIITQSLAWLIGPSSPLDPSGRQRVIDALFGPCPSVDTMIVLTELERIDLALVWSDRLIIAVEVKLKSRLGRSQLPKLNAAIEALGMIDWLNTTAIPLPSRRFLLTFSNERAPDADWTPLDFSRVCMAFSGMDAGSRAPVAGDFVSLLEKLLAAREVFCADHTQHPQVFRFSGAKTNELLRHHREIAALRGHTGFIVRNRLSRIFIETLLWKVVDAAEVKQANVGETHGQAQINVPLFEGIRFNAVAQDCFRAALQYQSGAWKLQVAAMDYSHSKAAWLPDTLLQELDKSFSGHDYKKSANKGTTHAYRAWQLADKTHLQQVPLADFVDEFRQKTNSARQVWAKTLKDWQSAGLTQPGHTELGLS
jgi:hypothetical protein